MIEDNCIFCRIVKKYEPAKIIFQDIKITAFWDTHPIAPVHILLIPNEHIPSINELKEEDAFIVAKLITHARMLAQEFDIADRGFRLVINTGIEGGQTINHLHLHLIGGRKFSPVLK